MTQGGEKVFKDGAYFCYCVYVLRIWRYSGFPWVVPTNTGIFLSGLKEKKVEVSKCSWYPKIGGKRAFFRDKKALIC